MGKRVRKASYGCKDALLGEISRWAGEYSID